MSQAAASAFSPEAALASYFTQWAAASHRKQAQPFFFPLKRLIQAKIHQLVDSKQTDHCTDRRRDRQDSNRLAEKNPRILR